MAATYHPLKVAIATVLLTSMLAGCDLIGGTDRRLSQVRMLLDHGDYATAVIAARNAARKDPDRADVLLLLARSQLMAGELKPGLQVVEHAVTVGVAPADAAVLRARLLLASGQSAELLQELDSGKSALDASVAPYYRARALQGAGRFIEALSVYEKLSSSPNGEADRLTFMAGCHAALGRRERALALLEQATRAGDSASAWLARAGILMASKDAPGAIAAARRAADLQPTLDLSERAMLFAFLVRRELEAGDLDAAAGDYASLVKAAPQSSLVRDLGWQLQLARGEATALIAQVQPQLQKDPRDGSPHLALLAAQLVDDQPALAVQQAALLADAAPNLRSLDNLHREVDRLSSLPAEQGQRAAASASVLLSIDYPGAARLLIERAQTANPGSMEIAVARVGLEMQLGRSKIALEKATALASEHAEVVKVQLALGAAQDAAGDLSASRATYEQAWKRTPDLGVLLALAGVMHRDGADAIPLLQDWLSKHPTDGAALAVLAQYEQDAGRLDAAARDLERLVAAAPRTVPFVNNLAEVYQRKGDRRAAALADRAFELAPDAPQVMDTYGWQTLQSGAAEAALPLLKSAAFALPDRLDVRFHLGVAEMRSGNRDLARLILQDVAADERPFAEREKATQALAELNAKL